MAMAERRVRSLVPLMRPAAKRWLAVALVGVALILPGRSASAQQLTNPRSMGMGDALRGAAVGAAGPQLNPSGIGLRNNYALEMSYLFRGSDSVKYFDATIIDSVTSRVAAAVFFNYLSADLDRSGYRTGVSIAVPILESFFFGTTLKYQDIGRAAPAGSMAGVSGKASGFNVDVGGTLKLLGLLSIGVVGQNLAAAHSLEAPRNVGVGFAVQPLGMLQLGFDLVFDFDSSGMLGKGDHTEQRYHAGGELSLFGRLALRAGYVRDEAYATSAVTYGASLLAGQFFVDFGARHVLDNSALFGVGLRLMLQ